MLTQEVIQLWGNYQNVVLHYSDLIFQFRLALIGSLGVFVGLIIYLFPIRGVEDGLESKLKDINLSRARFFVAVIATVLFIGGYIMDIHYYSNLYVGAVKAVITFEEQYSQLDFNLRALCGLTNDFNQCVELKKGPVTADAQTLKIEVIYWVVIAVTTGFTLAMAYEVHMSRKEFNSYCDEEEARLDEEELGGRVK